MSSKTEWLVVAAALACGCGGQTAAGSPTSADASTSADADMPIDPSEIVVDCGPELVEPGRFQASCQYIGASNITAQCEHVSEPGAGGMIVIVVNKPERITIGTPAPIGGADPVISVGFASTSVREGLFSSIDGTEEGSIVFSRFEAQRILRGRFVGATLQARPEPPFACRIVDHDFVADWGPGVTDN